MQKEVNTVSVIGEGKAECQKKLDQDKIAVSCLVDCMLELKELLCISRSDFELF